MYVTWSLESRSDEARILDVVLNLTENNPTVGGAIKQRGQFLPPFLCGTDVGR